MYTPDATLRTIQVEPAARLTQRPVSASNVIGPVRAKSSMCECNTSL